VVGVITRERTWKHESGCAYLTLQWPSGVLHACSGLGFGFGFGFGFRFGFGFGFRFGFGFGFGFGIDSNPSPTRGAPGRRSAPRPSPR
jgi:hypothetical protein